MMILEAEDQDVASLNQRGQVVRLHELKQQLEIAESRCDTLKQQLDYMRNLYHGAHVKNPSEQKPNKDPMKRKSKGKHKSRRFNIETSPDVKCSDTSISKINKLSMTPCRSSKNRLRLNKGDKMYTLKPATNMPNMTTGNYQMLGPCGESPENVAFDFPIKEVNTQSRPLSAQSTPNSPRSKSPVLYSRPVSTHGTIMQNSLEISPDTTQHDDDRENKLESTSSAVKAIQDILCGITNSVNRKSELNDFIIDGEREGQPNMYHRNQIKQDGEANIRELNVDVQNNNQTSSDGRAENNTEQLYGNVQMNTSMSKKSNRSRAGKRDIPPKLLSTPYTTESIESVRGGKRKGKSHAKHSEKKSKALGLPHLLTSKRTRITDDVISVTTKIRKKRNPKLWYFNSKNTNISPNHQEISYKSNHNIIGDSPYSQVPIPYHVWRSDNVVELYHNASLHADTSASDDTFSRLTRPKSDEYPQKDEYLQEEIMQQKGQMMKNESYKIENDEEGYHISEEYGNEMINDSIMQNSMQPIVSGEQIQRAVENHFRECNSVPSAEDMDNTNISIGSQDNTKSMTTRNFQLPTVSSRLKQVDRNYFRRFNFHSIPFVAGTSTSPSHNLGLNIQQILSIIKMRQPLGNYVPGIINRNLFGTKQNQPLNTLPRESSHTSHRTNVEFPEIPEKDETKEQCNTKMLYNQSYTRKYDKQYGLRPKTAGQLYQVDYDPKSQRPGEQWTVEQKKFESRGTKSNLNSSLFPTRRCVNYQKILNQYLEGGEKLSFLKSSVPYQNCIPYKAQQLRPHYSTMSRMQHHLKMPTVMSIHSLKEGRLNELRAMDSENMLNRGNRDIKKKDPDFFVNIQGKAKSLKNVLTNLHDDFRRLNSKYEELQAGVTQDSVNEMEALKQLDAMELELQVKEEEITIVMALYKEVVSLKEQVRALKEHASMANFNQQPVLKPKPHRLAPREPTAAVRLTRLLRTIQQFQERLRHD